MKKENLIHGFGINDADYVTQKRVNGKMTVCTIFSRWKSMIKRCYSAKSLKRRPTYSGCTVCNEWRYFMKFKEWMERQDYIGNELDKDILIPGNRVYSPETCCFVSKEINALVKSRNNKKSNLPEGVCYDKQRKKYKAYLCVKGKRIGIGRFFNPNEAHARYIQEKAGCIRELALYCDNDIANGLFRYAQYIEKNALNYYTY